jgi:hypothetical protein
MMAGQDAVYMQAASSSPHQAHLRQQAGRHVIQLVRPAGHGHTGIHQEGGHRLPAASATSLTLGQQVQPGGHLWGEGKRGGVLQTAVQQRPGGGSDLITG